MGLYLAVLDRRTLQLVETGIYNTTTIPNMYGTSGSWEKVNDYLRIDDFTIAREMA